MKKKSLSLHYSLIQSCYWMGYAVLSAFASMFLLDAGLSNTEIGILLACSGALSSILQPVVSTYADRPESPSLRRIMLIIGAVIAVLSALLFPLSALGKIAVSITYLLSVALMQTMLPLVNALAMDTINQGHQLNFGLSRSAGSIGYAVISYAMGIASVSLGAKIVPIMAIIMSGLFTVSAAIYPVGKSTTLQQATRQASSSGSFSVFFRKYRRYVIMLVGMTLVYTSHVVLNSYTLQIVYAKGGSGSEMGLVTAISAMIEVPIMCIASWLVRRFRVDRMVRLSAFFFFFKALGTQLAGTMSVYIAVQVFQMLGWGLMSVTLVYYVNRLVNPEDAVKGQGYATMANMLGYVIGAVIGGRLLDISVNTMLVFGSISAGIGAVVVLFTAEKTALPQK